MRGHKTKQPFPAMVGAGENRRDRGRSGHDSIHSTPLHPPWSLPSTIALPSRGVAIGAPAMTLLLTPHAQRSVELDRFGILRIPLISSSCCYMHSFYPPPPPIVFAVHYCIAI